MKKIKVRNLSLIILSFILMFCLSTNVLATDLIDISSNSTGKTNTTNNTENTQNITQIETPTFSTVNETVYAKNNTNIKSSYTTSSSNIGTLAKDKSIKRTGISSNGWSRVETSNGTIGYIATTDLTTTAPTSTISNTNISNTNTSIYNNTNRTNNTNTLPQTGIGDNTGMYIIMGICIISAIYAYKKIRDYNI